MNDAVMLARIEAKVDLLASMFRQLLATLKEEDEGQQQRQTTLDGESAGQERDQTQPL